MSESASLRWTLNKVELGGWWEPTRNVNSFALGMLRIVPATALYDAVFYHHVTEDKKTLMVRALLWKPGARVRRLYITNLWVPTLRDLREYVDVYSTVFLAVQGPLAEISGQTDNQSEEFGIDNQIKQTMLKLMKAEVPDQFSVLQTYQLVPSLSEDEAGYVHVNVGGVVPVRITRNRILRAFVSYELAFDNCPYYSEDDVNESVRATLLLV